MHIIISYAHYIVQFGHIFKILTTICKMNLILTRKDCNKDGIFSVLTDQNNNQIAVTLEHSYPDNNGGWFAKIPTGTFICVRGSHRLNGMTQDFETFEITGVTGHVNLLFHWGNYDKDSEGCILVGEKRIQDMITNSRVTFTKLMDLQNNIDQFTLTVI